MKETHAATASPIPVTDVPSTSACHCEAVEDGPSCSGSSSPSSSDSLALLALELGISEDQVAWLSRLRPELLHRPTSRLRKRLQGLAALLGCSVQQAACMTQKQPALLDIASESIHQRLARLTAGLGVDRRRACATARRMPRLLVSDQHVNRLEQHMQQLQSIFARPSPADIGALAVKEPQLLVMEPAEIRQRLQALAACLEVNGSEGIVRICCSHPWLLTLSPTSITSKIATLGSAMHLAPSSALRLVHSYPQLLQQSEQGVLDKTAILLKVFPRHILQLMVCREPSLLTRSCTKILQTFRAAQEATSLPREATLDMAARRPAILTRSSQAPARCYRALSVWKLRAEEKQQLVQEHPILLRLSPREVHLRCRWLRQLVVGNGLYHSTFRRIPMTLLGIVLLHLPVAWSRLQYLTESSREGMMELMDVVQARPRQFDARFPDYRRWLHYKTSEMGCQVPWRKGERKKQLGGPRPAPQGPSTSCSGVSEEASSPYSWHASTASPGHRPQQQTVIGEADVIYYGPHLVRKPRRLAYTSAPPPGTLPAASTPAPGDTTNSPPPHSMLPSASTPSAPPLSMLPSASTPAPGDMPKSPSPAGLEESQGNGSHKASLLQPA